MAASDYMPQKDGDLVPWTENFIAVANANLATLGLTAPDITALTTKKSDYSTGLNNAIAKQAESKAATDKKNITKDFLKDNIRMLARQIQAKPGVPDNIKIQLGLKAPDPIPTPTGPFIPTDLSIESLAANTFLLKWNRNNNPQGTNFILETSGFPDKDFIMINTTTKSSIETTHRSAVGPTFFRVKAKKGDITTDPSNLVAI